MCYLWSKLYFYSFQYGLTSVPESPITFILMVPQIYLMPQSLARKRVWNKKYPVCIELAKQDDFMSKAQGERCDAGEDKLAGLGEKSEQTEKVEAVEGSASVEELKRPTSGGGDLTIYLFGRTGREKEEWFRRFLQASRMKSEGRGSSLSGICKSGESDLHTRKDQCKHIHLLQSIWSYHSSSNTC